MNKENLLSVMTYIKQVFVTNHKIYMKYIMSENLLQIGEYDDVILKIYGNISLTNIKCILSMVKNHELFEYYQTNSDIKIEIIG